MLGKKILVVNNDDMHISRYTAHIGKEPNPYSLSVTIYFESKYIDNSIEFDLGIGYDNGTIREICKTEQYYVDHVRDNLFAFRYYFSSGSLKKVHSFLSIVRIPSDSDIFSAINKFIVKNIIYPCLEAFESRLHLFENSSFWDNSKHISIIDYLPTFINRHLYFSTTILDLVSPEIEAQTNSLSKFNVWSNFIKHNLSSYYVKVSDTLYSEHKGKILQVKSILPHIDKELGCYIECLSTENNVQNEIIKIPLINVLPSSDCPDNIKMLIHTYFISFFLNFKISSDLLASDFFIIRFTEIID